MPGFGSAGARPFPWVRRRSGPPVGSSTVCSIAHPRFACSSRTKVTCSTGFPCWLSASAGGTRSQGATPAAAEASPSSSKKRKGRPFPKSLWSFTAVAFTSTASPNTSMTSSRVTRLSVATSTVTGTTNQSSEYTVPYSATTSRATSAGPAERLPK